MSEQTPAAVVHADAPAGSGGGAPAWEQAERRLHQALRRMRGQHEQTAKLYHRLAEGQLPSVIMAAPTVALVPSSIRMRPPVVRFLA